VGKVTAREIRAPRGPERTCKGWPQEAALVQSGKPVAVFRNIGTQGILQGTYETLAEAATQHFGGSLRGTGLSRSP
jgi:urocanate hydratase